MEHVLTQLNLYCEDILGEPSKAIKAKKKSERKLNKLKKSILGTNENFTDESLNFDDKPTLNNRYTAKTDEIESESNPKFKTENTKFTEDGFKITHDIPPDDSDISDAFTSDYEDDNDLTLSDDGKCSGIEKQKNKMVSTKERFTADGFKIASSVPDDDSDISDAFDDFECEDLEGTFSKQEKKEVKEKRNDKLKKLKKPLLQLISDFDMEDKLFSKKKYVAGVPRDLSSQNLNIIDYSKKRGKSKTENLNPTPEETKAKNIEEKEQFKKARYDIFKFGITGFEKEEKRNLKIALAIKLGAKPPKNIAKNYKDIMERRKTEKKLESERLERKDDPLSKIKAKAIAKKKDKAPLHGITTGKFTGGVLKLSKSDIKKIQSSR